MTRRSSHDRASSHYTGAVVCALLLASCLPAQLGCATFGRRARQDAETAACRELSRQGIAAMEAGQWLQSESYLRRAVESSPDDAAAHQYLAEVLWQRGASMEALSHIATAVRLNSHDATLAARAGEMALAVGADDEALQQAEQALRLDPMQSAAWALRGRAFARLNHPDRALADMHHAAELAPMRADVLLDLAAMYRKRGQPERSLAVLHNLFDKCPTDSEPPNARLLEGIALLELGRPIEATDSLQLAVKRSPPTADTLYWLAQAQYAAGSRDEAAATAQQALALDAAHQPSRQLIAHMARGATAGEVSRQ